MSLTPRLKDVFKSSLFNNIYLCRLYKEDLEIQEAVYIWEDDTQSLIHV